jgi:steroid delta-isomerase-like uncharacterized protein
MVTAVSKISQEYLIAFNAQNIEKIISMAADDCLLESIGMGTVYHGQQELRGYYRDFFTAFPDVKMEFKSDFRSGDWSATEWEWTGTNSGKLTGGGNMPLTIVTGKKVTLKGATIVQYRNGKMARQTDYWNLVPFMQQLGLMQQTPSQ